MNIYKRLLLSSFCLTAPFVVGASETGSAETNQQVETRAGSATAQGKATAAKKSSAPAVEEIRTTTPFVIKGGFGRLPEQTVEEVKAFEGEAVFRKMVDEKFLTVWSIGRFASATLPKDEAAFRNVLRTHAAKIGADYLVIITDAAEIKRLFPARYDELGFCALAYKRVPARIGVECDKEAAQEKIMKVSGFTPGSKAGEAGLLVGDLIKKVEGTMPGSNEMYWQKAVRWKIGDRVKVEIERDGKPVALEVELTAG